MAQGVVGQLARIGAFADDPTILDDDGADRDFAARRGGAGKLQGPPHPGLAVSHEPRVAPTVRLAVRATLGRPAAVAPARCFDRCLAMLPIRRRPMCSMIS